MLAYQHTGQGCGYWPSSTSNGTDMINVRQGRYVIWGPEHLIVNVDSNGNPLDHTLSANPAGTTFMNAFIETGPKPSLTSSADGGLDETATEQIILAEATAGVVPWCAMQVQRTAEIGAESSYQPVGSCGCYFESSLGATSPGNTCTPCIDDTACTVDPARSVCSHHYCEAM
jgi:hypothetical protein